MSLAKRLFGGFRPKKDAGEEQPPTPAKGAKVPPPPPKIARADAPTEDAAPLPQDKRVQSQTFQVTAPRPPAAGDDAAAASAGRRVVPLQGSERPAETAAPATVDAMRRSQTIRVAPPGLAASADQAASGPAGPLALRRSQTIRVNPPAAGASAAPEPAGLHRLHPHPQTEVPPLFRPAGVALPLQALLAGVPPHLRGPAWDAGHQPDGTLTMAPDLLRAQLAAGRCYLGVEEARAFLPQGWIEADAVGDLDLDMACVVAALPPGFSPVLKPAPKPAPPAPPPAPPEPVAPVPAEAPSLPVTEAQTEAEPAVARLPWAIVLAAVPAGLRGQAWREGSTPEGTVAVPREVLLEQLGTGRISLDIRTVSPQLPAGWVAPQAQGSVVLDLAAVVELLPPQWLRPVVEEDEEVRKAEALGDLFKPLSASPPEPPPVPVPEEASVALPAAVVLAALPAALRGPAWSADAPEMISVRVPRGPLLRQLAAGHIELDLETLVAQLPPGSCQPGSRGSVTPELGAVVAALPPELLQVPGELAEDAKAVAGMGDLFGAAGKGAPVPVPVPVPQPKGDTLAIPCAAALRALLPAMRGPAWRADGFPEGSVEWPKADVLSQLSTGTVKVSVAAVAKATPPGWIADGVQGDVALDLADVVAAVPAEVLSPAGEMAEEVQETAAMGALFAVAAKPAGQGPAGPAAPAVATPPEALPPEAPPQAHVAALADTAAAAAVATPPEAPPPARVAVPAERAEETHTIRPARPEPDLAEEPDLLGVEGVPADWDGVEESLETAPLGVDINTARAVDLMLLPGVGETRARAVIDHRTARGPFRSVFELADVSGFGPTLFRRVTGLSLRRRVNRHRLMEQVLPLPPGGPALLNRITEAVRAEFAAVGAVLTNRAGMAIAVAGTMPEAGKYAALGSRYFFRTRRQLQKFVDRASDCIILPGSKPPLLLLSSEDVVMILSLSGSVVPTKRLTRVRRAMQEIGWLVSRRAVVLNV